MPRAQREQTFHLPSIRVIAYVVHRDVDVKMRTMTFTEVGILQPNGITANAVPGDRGINC